MSECLRKSYPLSFDFTKQMEVSKEKNETFHLKLIYSDFNSSVQIIPSNISAYTSTEYFPACDSINQLILSYPSFKNTIQNIAIQEQAEEDELSGIATAILGAWCSVTQKDISLQQILNIVYAKGKGFINIKSFPTIEISDICKKIFTQFKLSFYTNGSILYCSLA